MISFVALGFLIAEYTTGQTKQCVYESLGSQYVLTIKSYQICPLNINR